MNMHSPDDDLLQLAHANLPRARRLAAQAHVTLCPRCRARLTKLEGASRLIADTIRGGDLPRWTTPAPRGAVAARTATAWLAVCVLMLALMLAVATQAVRVSRQSPPTPQAAPDGCRPDLPSDKCR